MACLNPEDVTQILEEENSVRLKETTPELATNNEFAETSSHFYKTPKIIHVNSSDSSSINFETIIHANVESIETLLKESIDWDHLIKTEPIEIVERKVIEELENDESNISPDIVIGALKTIVTISESFDDPKLEILNLVLNTLSKFQSNVHVQLWGLKALNCLKAYLSFDLNEEILVKVFNQAIIATQRFKNDGKLRQISLNIINDLYRCFQSNELTYVWQAVEVTMNALYVSNNTKMHKLSLQILSKLLQFHPKPIQEIGTNQLYRKILYNILEEKIKALISDEELKIVLDMWKEITYNISSRNCFIFENKLDLIIQLLDQFPKDMIIVEKALSIMEQIGRQDEAEDLIVTKEMTLKLINFVRNENTHISFLSATILVNRISRKFGKCKFEQDLLHKINRVIKSAVLSWDSKSTKEELIKLESLKPLMDILKSNEETAYNLYAAWTMNHLCSQNPKIYARLLRKEKILKDLEACTLQSYNCQEIKIFLTSALTHIKSYLSSRKKTEFTLSQIRKLLRSRDVTPEVIEDLELENEKCTISDTIKSPLDIYQEIRAAFNQISEKSEFFQMTEAAFSVIGQTRNVMSLLFNDNYIDNDNEILLSLSEYAKTLGKTVFNFLNVANIFIDKTDYSEQVEANCYPVLVTAFLTKLSKEIEKINSA